MQFYRVDRMEAGRGLCVVYRLLHDHTSTFELVAWRDGLAWRGEMPTPHSRLDLHDIRELERRAQRHVELLAETFYFDGECRAAPFDEREPECVRRYLAEQDDDPEHVLIDRDATTA